MEIDAAVACLVAPYVSIRQHTPAYVSSDGAGAAGLEIEIDAAGACLVAPFTLNLSAAD